MTISFQYVTLNDADFRITFSDKGNFIENEEGVRYGKAYDLVGSPHTYTETDVNIEEWEKEQENNTENQGEPELP